MANQKSIDSRNRLNYKIIYQVRKIILWKMWSKPG